MCDDCFQCGMERKKNMTIDWNRPVQTRLGYPVTILSRNGRGDYPVKGYIGDNPGLSSWTWDGRGSACLAQNSDLINVPEKPLEVWINIPEGGLKHSGSSVWLRKELADMWEYVNGKPTLFREVKE